MDLIIGRIRYREQAARFLLGQEERFLVLDPDLEFGYHDRIRIKHLPGGTPVFFEHVCPLILTHHRIESLFSFFTKE